MKFQYLVFPILGFLLLTACEESDLSQGKVVRGETASSTVGDSAEEIHSRLKKLLDGIRHRREALCPQNHALHRFLHETFRAIHLDSTLSEMQKRERAQEVFDRYRGKIDADIARMEACIQPHADEWLSLEIEDGDLRGACLPSPIAGMAPPFEDANAVTRRPPPPPPFPPPPLNLNQWAERQALLTSAACAKEVKKYEGGEQ